MTDIPRYDITFDRSLWRKLWDAASPGMHSGCVEHVKIAGDLETIARIDPRWDQTPARGALPLVDWNEHTRTGIISYLFNGEKYHFEFTEDDPDGKSHLKHLEYFDKSKAKGMKSHFMNKAFRLPPYRISLNPEHDRYVPRPTVIPPEPKTDNSNNDAKRSTNAAYKQRKTSERRTRRLQMEEMIARMLSPSIRDAGFPSKASLHLYVLGASRSVT